MKRYYLLDAIRGFTLISMLLYHGVWDLVHLFHKEWNWYTSMPGYLWQQSICCMFILISGFCWPLGKHKWKRSGQIFAGGMIITLFTTLFVPGGKVIFGILTFLGIAIVCLIFLEPLLKHIMPLAGTIGSLVLFFTLKNINKGFLGWKNIAVFSLPKGWYRNYCTALFGFPFKTFYSADYFSILPWIFLYLTGYFLYHLMKKAEKLNYLERHLLIPVEWLGRNSFLIYLFHQPVIFGTLSIYFNLI